jgi:hypothetical protein
MYIMLGPGDKCTKVPFNLVAQLEIMGPEANGKILSDGCTMCDSMIHI